VASDFGSEGDVIIGAPIVNPLSRNITSYYLQGAISTADSIMEMSTTYYTRIILILCVYLALFTVTLPSILNCTVNGAISFASFRLTRIVICAI